MKIRYKIYKCMLNFNLKFAVRVLAEFEAFYRLNKAVDG
jgi:hypothetical protein